MFKTEDGWKLKFRKLGAFWVHSGNMTEPHALLTGGKHSSGLFNGNKVIQYPSLLKIVCSDLLEKAGVKNANIRTLPFSSVFGIASGSSDMSLEIGRQLGVRSGFVSKAVGEKGKKKMILGRFSVKKNEIVLLVDDVFTTGGSLELAISALESAGAVVFNTILVITNRSSNSTQIMESGEKQRNIISLVESPMPIWTENECPLCKQGSKAIRLKGVMA
jgi:orotate phosphoribosyltransferase